MSSTAENLQPFQRVLCWSLFSGAKDNRPNRHNGTWDSLAKLLTTVQKTPRRKSPDDAKKAVPAFSGASFFDGTVRGCDNCESMHLLVFDFDNCIEEPIPAEFHKSGRPKTRKVPIADPADPEPVVERLKALGLASVVYTTWSSSPQLVKFRVVIPLQAPISPAYWVQATEWAMDQLGFMPWKESRAIDIPVLRDVARLNFLPCSMDPGSIRIWETKGKPLNIPEQALATLEVQDPPPPAWLKPRAKTNPRTGRDWWRDYRINFKTLDLAGVMSAMGVKVGKAQAWHSGFKFRCHCPWSAEHTHALDDDSAVIIQTPGDWPSFKCAHSGHVHIGLQDICEAAGKPLVESHAQPYRVDPAADPDDDSDSMPPAAGNEEQIPVWNRLHRGTKGETLKVPANLAKILRWDPQWGARLSLNEMSRDICHDGENKSDFFVDEVQEWVQDTYNLNFGREEVAAKLLAQASQNIIHPFREWLKTLQWDGTERIHRLAGEVLGAPSPMATHYLRCTMIGAVRRVFHPGTKMDTLPVLEGVQGLGKSTFWQSLVGRKWFCDSPLDLDNKDGFMVLHRKVCTEIAELDSMTTTKAAERVKAFCSSSEDVFRPPYGKAVQVFPRSCFLVGTTNTEGFLVDPSGSRRFWPIKCFKIDNAKVEEWRDQLWAEAVDLYKAGVPHWLDSSQETMRADEAHQFEAEDPWEEQIQLAVESLTRLNRFKSDGYSITDILGQMGIPAAQQNRSMENRLGKLLRKLGWVRKLTGAERSRRWFHVE